MFSCNNGHNNCKEVFCHTQRKAQLQNGKPPKSAFLLGPLTWKLRLPSLSFEQKKGMQVGRKGDGEVWSELGKMIRDLRVL
jgi:hypothetical protein